MCHVQWGEAFRMTVKEEALTLPRQGGGKRGENVPSRGNKGKEVAERQERKMVAGEN